jgi:DNA-binding MarR family transcriptional regulator
VLSQLLREGYIEQHMATDDRRKRLLRLTERGVALERALTARQRKRIQGAYEAAGTEAVEGFKAVMQGIMDSADRWRFEPADEAKSEPGQEEARS